MDRKDRYEVAAMLAWMGPLPILGNFLIRPRNAALQLAVAAAGFWLAGRDGLLFFLGVAVFLGAWAWSLYDLHQEYKRHQSEDLSASGAHGSL